MSIVFILCVPVGGVVLRLVFVLSYVMMEKVESLLRGHWSAFNIYRAFSSSRLVWRLAFASRVGVPWRLLVYCVSSVLLVSSSRRRLLVVASCRFIFSVLSRFLSLCLARGGCGSSRRERFVSLYLVYRVSHRGVSSRSSASCFVSPLVSFSSRPVLLLSPFVACVAWRGCPCHHVVRAVGVLFPYF